jgi:hypothetical protein
VKFLFDKGDVTKEDALAGFELATSNNNPAVVQLLLRIASISDVIAIKLSRLQPHAVIWQL